MNWKKKHPTTEDFPLEKHVQPERHNFFHNCKVRGTQTSGIYSQKSYSKLIRIIIVLECISSEEAKQFVRHPDVLQIPSVIYANRNPLRGIPAQESDSVRCCIKYEPMKYLWGIQTVYTVWTWQPHVTFMVGNVIFKRRDFRLEICWMRDTQNARNSSPKNCKVFHHLITLM